MGDERLLKLLRDDPERGMETVLSLYGGLVASLARGRLKAAGLGEADVEDCVAETFAEFYAGLDRVDPERGSVKAYLCAMAAHNAADLIRRVQPAVPLEEAEASEDATLEGDFEDRERRRELLEAVKALGEPDREIVVRKYYLAQPSREIGKALGLTAANVDVRAHRAVEKLRRKFGGETDE